MRRKNVQWGAMLACACVAGCGVGTQDGTPSADADKYGVDGFETLGGRNYSSARSMFDRFAKGEIGCVDFKFADNSCTYANYASSVRKDDMSMSGYRIEPGFQTKQHYPFELALKGKFLCETTRVEDVDNWTLVTAGDRKPQISNMDITFDKQRQDQWRDSNRRSMAKDFGVENCYRYSIVMKDGVPAPGQYREHRFVDGIEQPRRRDRIVSMIRGNEMDFLILRPDTEY